MSIIKIFTKPAGAFHLKVRTIALRYESISTLMVCLNKRLPEDRCVRDERAC